MTASGHSIYLQKGHYASFACPICNRTVRPTGKTQRTCGGYSCGERWGKYMAQVRYALANGAACCVVRK